MNKYNTKKIRSIILITVGALVALVVIAHVLLLVLARPKLEQALDNLIVTGSDSLYSYRYDNLDIKWWPAGITLSNLEITIDSVRYAKMRTDRTVPSITLSGNFPHIAIRSIVLWDLLVNRSVKIDEVQVAGADLLISRHFKTQQDTAKRSLLGRLQSQINALHINVVNVSECHITYQNVDSARKFSWQIGEGQMHLQHIDIDQETSSGSGRVLYSDALSLIFKESLMKTSDGLYSVGLGRVEYSSRNRNLSLDSLHLKPTVAAPEFYRQIGHQKDRYFLKIPHVDLAGFDLGELLRNNALIADSLHLQAPEITVYNDRTVREFTGSKLGKFPQQLLKRASFGINVKEAVISDADIVYKERARISGREAQISFTNSSANISNITNLSSSISRDNTVTAQVQSTVLGGTRIRTTFRFMLDRNDGAFSLEARLGKISEKQINPLSVPLANVRFESFDISRISANIRGSQHQAKGNVHIIYDDLEVDLLEIDEEGQKPDKKTVTSFLANTLGIHKANPKNGEERAATITQDRNISRSFFNLIWKTLLSGLQEIILKEAAQSLINKKK